MVPKQLHGRRQFLQASSALAMTVGVSQAFGGTVQWPSWRGPNRDGVVGGGELPTSLSELNLAWSASLEDSYSGPILANDMVYTTETVGRQDETLIALSVETGEQVWKQAWAGAMSVPFFAKSNGDWIRSTPATDGDCVVVGGMRDVVACFDAKSGDERWRIDFVKDHGAALPPFGLVCSPAIVDDAVYMQAGGAVRKIDLKSGELIWEQLPDDGGMSGGAFSSPTLAKIHGVEQLVVQTRTTLGGIELATGKVLWKQDIAAFRGMNILTPTVWNDCVFTSSYGGKSLLFSLEPKDGEWGVQKVWENGAEAYMSSPVVVGDHLYMHLRNKRCMCLDLTTGAETWRSTPFGKYWSMLTDGQNILALDETGELLLLEANPDEFSVIEKRAITDEQAWAHIAIADGSVYVRRQKGLDVYRSA